MWQRTCCLPADETQTGTSRPQDDDKVVIHCRQINSASPFARLVQAKRTLCPSLELELELSSIRFGSVFFFRRATKIVRHSNRANIAPSLRLLFDFIQHQDCAEFYTIPLISKRFPTSCGRGRRRWRRLGDLRCRLLDKRGSRKHIGARLPFVGDAPICGKSVSTKYRTFRYSSSLD